MGALAGAVPLFEGTPFYIDEGVHEQFGKHPMPNNLAGHVRNARFDRAKGQVRGDIQVMSHFEWVLNIAEQQPHTAGCSPVMSGRAVRRGGSESIEQIVKVNRVDLVTRPGTVSGLHESEEEAPVEDIKTLEDLRAAHPELVKLAEQEALTDAGAAMETDALKVELAAVKSQLAESAKAMTALTAEKEESDKKASAAKLLSEAGLPDYALTDAFRTLVESAADEKAMTALIEDRKVLVDKVPKKVGGVGTKPGKPLAESAKDGAAPAITDDDAIVAAVKG